MFYRNIFSLMSFKIRKRQQPMHYYSSALIICDQEGTRLDSQLPFWFYCWVLGRGAKGDPNEGARSPPLPKSRGYPHQSTKMSGVMRGSDRYIARRPCGRVTAAFQGFIVQLERLCLPYNCHLSTGSIHVTSRPCLGKYQSKQKHFYICLSSLVNSMLEMIQTV